MNRSVSVDGGQQEAYVRLSHSQIIQDFFCATQDGVELLGSPEHFDVLAHSRTSQATTTEDLRR